MKNIGIVSVGCGSIKDGVTCETSNLRDQYAVELACKCHELGFTTTIIATGNVPRYPGGVTLAELKQMHMHHLLELFSLDKDIEVLIANKGYDSFSEARHVTGSMAKELKLELVYLVSSDWYMSYGGLIWLRRARKNGLELIPKPITTPAGTKTLETYRRNAKYLNIALMAGSLGEWALEKAVSFQTRKRLESFTWSGCD